MAARTRVDRGVAVGLHSLELSGHLTVPEGASAVVLFVPDPRTLTRAPEHRIASQFVDAGLGTLNVDLLAADERDQGTDGAAPDADLLAVRVLAVTRWLHAHPDTRDRAVAYFGAREGAGIALLAAAEDPTVAALVAHDGRLDLAESRLSAVRAPTLLLVDDAERAVAAANQIAMRHLRCEHSLVVVPHASDPADELYAVANRSVDWFSRHLAPADHSDSTPIRGTEEP